MTRNIQLTSCLLLCLALGCSEPGVKRYDVAGQVSWNGEPLKAGYILFDPDAKKGNTGPQGLAIIANGRFDTRAKGGRGVSPGDQILDVSGYDGANATEDNPLGKLVFLGYKKSESINQNNFDLNIQIPKDAVIIPKF
jgi:hypothetical protein